MTDLQKLLVVAALFNSALYLTGVFVAGLLMHSPVAWKLALASSGLCFLCYALQYVSGLYAWAGTAAGTAAAASIVAGVIAGLALLLV
jgi:hypothetical protein